MKNDSLGDRMKSNYEGRAASYLTRRTPVIMRLDGKAFHTFTRGCQKPFDSHLAQTMDATAMHLMKQIQGAKMAYVQSDEISLLITDYDTFATDAWFDYNVQKMCSISAAEASVFFTLNFNIWPGSKENFKPALFDSRVFNIPKEEVANYFRWRYMDWQRNSIQMLAQSLFSHKQLQGIKKAGLHEMCFQKGSNWNDLDPRFKNGRFIFRMQSDQSTIETRDTMNAMSPEFVADIEEAYLQECSE